ncbi:MAG: hypothetical protein H6545_00195 [Bacteroidales bacterium]|jgi:hypothetical protein|nr:hypothetical protein [Bacteroidales bacterium]MDD3736958.1 hypothetical protein [Bacteroidales bacterium]NLD62918.1 hypothetical protein [Bacteroidales bacterium]HNT92922.1 hypothetical protein [Bacteroidales bacterium]HOO66879.1 hypothetical protein [Bacteroidales bacterium]
MMRKTYLTASLLLAALLSATVTLPAQKTGKVEKKVIVVTEEDDVIIAKDTTFSDTDTLVFEDGNLVITTREGRKIIRKPGEGSRMVWVGAPDEYPGRALAPGINTERNIARMREEREGVSYNISVDGVVVNIRAPKEKTKEADQILSEVKKILMKK